MLAVWVLCVAVGAVCATDNAEGDLYLSEGFIDAGYHQPQEAFDVATLICNFGSSAVGIKELDTSCECVTAAIVDKTIEPDSCAEVAIHVETGDLEGDQNRVITVRTSSVSTPRLRVGLSFHVNIGAACDPQRLWIGPIRPGATVSGTISVASMMGGSGSLLDAVTDDPGLKPVILDREVDPNHAGRVDWSFTAPATLGAHKSSFAMHTTIPGSSIVRVPVYAVVSEGLPTVLRTVDLETIACGKPMQLRIDVKTSGLKWIRVRSVVRPEALDAWFEKSETPDVWHLVVTHDGTGDYGPIRGLLKVETSGKERLKFMIPVEGYLEPPRPPPLGPAPDR